MIFGVMWTPEWCVDNWALVLQVSNGNRDISNAAKVRNVGYTCRVHCNYSEDKVDIVAVNTQLLHPFY